MNIYIRVMVIVLSALLAFGCISSSSKKTSSPELKLIDQHIAKGEELESLDRYSSALEQYEIALTIDPENKSAGEHKKQVLSKLWSRAQDHYNKGAVLDKQGKYEAARKEYLSALQNWPDHQKAKEKLTPGGVAEDAREYITHTLASGESVSKLGLIYYGDLKKYPVIGKFNHLEDVTKVRIGQKLKIPVIEGISLASLEQAQKKYINSKKNRKKPVPPPKKSVKKEETSLKKKTVQTDLKEKPVDPPESVPPEMKKKEETKKDMADNRVAAIKPKDSYEKKTSMERKPVSYDKAVEFFNKKEYTKAIPLFEEAEKADPENETLRNYLFESYFQLGLIQFDSDQFLPAKRSFEAALGYDVFCEMCPDYIDKSESTYKEKHYNLGIHFFGKEELKKAIDEWKLVEKIDPDYKDLAQNLKKAELLNERLERIKQGSTQ